MKSENESRRGFERATVVASTQGQLERNGEDMESLVNKTEGVPPRLDAVRYNDHLKCLNGI